MASYVKQVECLQCSNSRGFVHHTETNQRLISQVEASRLHRQAALSCGRCGCTSLILAWADAIADAPAGATPRRRARRDRPTAA